MRITFTLLACVFLAACSGPTRSIPVSFTTERALHNQATNRYTSIFSFDGENGALPYAGLVDVNGTLYGTTSTGSVGAGVVFKITPAGDESVLYSFAGGAKGSAPYAPLVYVNGALYGTTFAGGSQSCGIVFRVTPAGAEKKLYSFRNNNDGCGPQAPLLDIKGTLYGTTRNGGAHSDGTVFRITTSGAEKVLYTFKGSTYSDAGAPTAGVTDVKGVLYGATNGGGPKQEGTVYKVTLSGNEKVLHIFNGKNGNGPLSTLVAIKGKLYGTTSSGGAHNLGTVFAVTTSGTLKVLHSFRGGADGATPPFGGLVSVNGNLYGVTSAGGKINAGTVFSITPTGKEKVLHSFGSGFDGANPSGALVRVGKLLFGTTTNGGNNGKGTVYSIQP